MPRPREEARVIGPTWLEKQGYWRIVVHTPEAPDPTKRKLARYYRDEDDANRDAEAARKQVDRARNVAVEDAIDSYEQHLQDKGTIGHAETIRRLHLFFEEHVKTPISRITSDRAGELYESFRQRKKRNKEPISVDYHRATLINARSFSRWCIKQGWLHANPFDGVEGVGRRNAGKEQHTGSEAQRFYQWCLDKAEAGDDAATGVLMALLMALRSSDITRRLVRDVDLDCTVLRVWDGKTKKSNRPRKIPRVLQPLLRRLVEGRKAFEPLFKTPYTEDGRHTHRWLQQAMVRFCRDAGVPYVCPHALKGTSGTLAAEMGELGDRIADHLSHEETGTTRRHYVEAGALEQAQADRALTVIVGGKK
jgi:integrase